MVRHPRVLSVASSAVAASLLRAASLALQDTAAVSSYPLQTIFDFSGGRMAMFSGSAGDMGQIEDADPNFEWRSTFIPRFEEYALPTGGANATILAKDGAKQEAAWKSSPGSRARTRPSSGARRPDTTR